MNPDTNLASSSKPYQQVMTITPSMAQRWLEGANTANRRLSMAYAERLAGEIRADRWMLTHEGIAFSPHGVLLDGQHRLQAIVLADKPVTMVVWFNISPKALLAINSGKARSIADTLMLAGGCGQVNNHDLATLRAMLGGMGSPPTLSAAQAAEALQRHGEAIEFASVYLPRNTGRGISIGTTRAVIARAYYSADANRLAEFCRVLTSSVATKPEDEPAVLLIHYLQRTLGMHSQTVRDRYAKTERALWAYLRREKLSRLYGTSEELFPLPEERKAQTAA